MKKFLWMLTITGLLFAAGCGKSEKTIEASSDPSADSGQEAEAPEGTGESGAAKAEKGYVFEAEGVRISVDADVEPLVEKLGEPDSYFEAASCAFEGLDKMYTYGGFRIDTYPDKEKDYVADIMVTDDSVVTLEGIRIGDTADQMKEVYGEDCTEETNMYSYEKDGMKLYFITDDGGVITSIEYRSPAVEAMY